MPQLDVETFPSLVFWLVISFGLLYMGLQYLVVPKLSKILETRLLKIENNLENARNFQKKAEEIHLNTEKKIQDARLESQKRLSTINSEIAEFIQLKDKEISEQFHGKQMDLDAKMDHQRCEVESQLKDYLKGMIGDILGRMSLKGISEDQIKEAIKGKDL